MHISSAPSDRIYTLLHIGWSVKCPSGLIWWDFTVNPCMLLQQAQMKNNKNQDKYKDTEDLF